MSIKAKLSAAEFTALPEANKAFYKQSGTDYLIDLSGGFVTEKDPAGLLTAKNHEVEKRKEAEQKLRDLQGGEQKKIDDAAKAAADEARKKALEGNDLTAITADFDARFAALEAKQVAELASRDAAVAEQAALVKASKLKAAASEIANRISTIPSLLVGNIQNRLQISDSGEIVATDALGAVLPDFTMSTLEKEFVDNSEYAAIMIGSKGSGASGSPTPGSPVDTGGKKWKDLSTDELVQLRKENPTGYKQLLATK